MYIDLCKKKRTRSLILFISFFCFFNYVFYFFDNFIYYLKKINRSFFVRDINRLAFTYFNNIFFISFIVYFPFVLIFVLFQTISQSIWYNYYFKIRYILSWIYIHYLSCILNHIDFALFFISIYKSNSMIDFGLEGIDLTIFLIHYQGFFWDFFIISFIFINIYFFIIEKPIYNFFCISQVRSKFWSSFYSLWIRRICIYSIIFYFFGNEGIFIDICVITFAIFCIECIIFTIRCFYIFKIHYIELSGLLNV